MKMYFVNGAKRILKSLTSLENIYLKQFAVFGHPDRTKKKRSTMVKAL